MLAFNHITGGVAITGISLALFDINIFAKPELVGITVFASLLPDIDHTRSTIGKVFLPIAKYLDRHFGHRTLTHSAVFWLGLSAICYLFELWFLQTSLHSGVFMLAYFTHLLLDMCTLSGIPFFYPVSVWRCVLPANPKLRIGPNDFVAEVAVCFVFIVGIFSMSDLIASGLTKKFETNFREFAHLAKSLHENKQAIEIVYLDAIGNRHKATVLEATKNKALVFEQNAKIFVELKENDNKISDIRQTKHPLLVMLQTFEDISLDSLRKILADNYILELEMVSSQTLIYWENNLRKTGKSIKVEKILSFTAGIPQEKDTAQADILLRIEKLQNAVASAQGKYSGQMQARQAKQTELQQIEATLPTLDNYGKTKAIAQARELRKQLEQEPPSPPSIESELAEIRHLQNSIGKKQESPRITGKAKLWKTYIK